MDPEAYLKALAMARNSAHQQGKKINRFTTAVFDTQDLGENYRQEAEKFKSYYYFRQYKTILVRTISDGGEIFYVQGDHHITFPNLYHRILEKIGKSKDETSISH
jgi:uncharacterized protein (UPF0248 family)